MNTKQHLEKQHLEQARRDQVAREDLVMFVNACFACSGQREFYSDGQDQRVSIDFLHRYILGNYRLLYARTLAAGINHFNQAQIIVNLLATGRDAARALRPEEDALLTAALHALPPPRAWRVLEALRDRRINNRRARAVAQQYVARRRDLPFDAVKYRSKVHAAARHAHLSLPGEVGEFLFKGWNRRVFQTPLLESFRQAHQSAEAVYCLPYTVAEGLAAKHKIPRALFLERIAPLLTVGERLRLQGASVRAGADAPLVDWGRLPLTRLALYALSLTDDERRMRRDVLHPALEAAARSALARAPLRCGRVAAVLDGSYSSSGSSEKRRRPLAVALAAHYLLQAAAAEYRAFWTPPAADALLARAHGQTDLATPLLDALEWGADLIVIVSDGCENDPPRGTSELLRVFRSKLDPDRRTSIVHCNPVFDPDDFSLRPLSPLVPTVGLRDAEDLPTMLGFARFAEGTLPLSELEAYLASRAAQMIGATPNIDGEEG